MNPALARALVETALPWITAWAGEMESRILHEGRALDPDEYATAQRAGVGDPSAIRILAVPVVPMPGPAWVQALAARLGFDGTLTDGMALGRGIFLRAGARHTPALIAHELRHCAQYETLGGLSGFLHRYLAECLHPGYHASELELDAVRFAAEEG